MEKNMKAEVNAQIRSAIKAKLMELGAYVDDELPDYIMVMVVNKRTKEQMEEDLQLFLGASTQHFTVWLHRVLQELEEVAARSKKTLKQAIVAESGNSDRKRKTSPGSVDGDGHKKEKRKTSHERKKNKKGVGETDKEKDGQEQNLNAQNSSVMVDNERTAPKTSLDATSQDAVAKVFSDNEDQADKVAETSDRKGNTSDKGATCQERKKTKGSVGDVDKGEDNVGDLGVATASDRIAPVAGTTVTSQETANQDTLVMSYTDDDDDDGDCINLRADAEAEALLNEELPKEATAPPSDPPVAEDTPVVVKKSVTTNPARRIISYEDSSEPQTVENSVGTIDHRRTVGSDARPTTVPLSERFNRKRKLDKDLQAGITPPIRLVTQALSIKDRLGVKKISPPDNSSLPTRPAPRVQDRLGPRIVTEEATKKKRIEPVVMSLNSAQAVEKAIRDRIYRRANDPTNQDQRKRQISSRVVLPQPGREEEEYDPTNPAVGTVASVVKVKPRPRVPAEMQANKNLLLKAMAEAQKSVAAAPVRPEPASPPRRNLSDSNHVRRARANNATVSLPNRRAQLSVSSQSADTTSERLVLPASHPRDKITVHVSRDSRSNITRQTTDLSNIRYKNVELTLDAEQELNHSIEFSVENEDDMLPDEGIVTEETEIEEEMPVVYPPVGLASRMPRERPQPARSESPQFLVTLDGLDPHMFSSHDDVADDEVCMSSNLQEDYEEQEDNSSKVSSSPSPTPKEKVNKSVSPIVFTKKDVSEESDLPKSLERCKFWPSCRLGDKCTFHHPTSPCKSFPKCQFRDKCLYIHPMCKFASSCTRKDCPFAHAGFTSVVAPVVAIPASRLKLNPAGSGQVCKYFPKCSNPLCQYLHPKPCRYGKFCSKKPNCNYLHDELPPVDKLKWTSPFRT